MFITPIIFKSSRKGVSGPMLGVAESLNPRHHIVIGNVNDYLKTIWEFRQAALEHRYTHADRRGEITIPVVITYNSAYLRWLATLGIKRVVPEAILVQIGPSSKSLQAFDVVAGIPGTNFGTLDPDKIVTIPALPSAINENVLHDAAEKWAPIIKREGKKLIAVFIGGNFKSKKKSRMGFYY